VTLILGGNSHSFGFINKGQELLILSIIPIHANPASGGRFIMMLHTGDTYNQNLVRDFRYLDSKLVKKKR